MEIRTSKGEVIRFGKVVCNLKKQDVIDLMSEKMISDSRLLNDVTLDITIKMSGTHEFMDKETEGTKY